MQGEKAATLLAFLYILLHPCLIEGKYTFILIPDLAGIV
jgi:hypothetical protein